MKAILTGMNGTVAPALARRFRQEVIDVVAWDRKKISIEDPAAVRSFIEHEKPDWVCHMAMGSPVWAATMARVCRENGIKFLFTGTCSVFDGSKPGPFPVDKKPDATDDYGRYKADCEGQILDAHHEAYIARLGWQIGEAPGSNNMIDFFYRMAREKGRVEVTHGVIHSSAFLVDTVDALYRLLVRHEPGLYQLEGNPGLTLFEIATRLNARYHFDFPIVPHEEPRRDIRMLNDKITMGQIT